MKKIIRLVIQGATTFVSSPLFILITGVTGVLSFLLSLQIFAVPDKMICYSIRSLSIVNEKIDKFNAKILYNKQSFERLTLTRVAVWNAGKKDIKREDIPPTDKLRICLSTKDKILDIDVMDKQSANNFGCTQNNSNEAIINFLFLGKKEGATIQIIHTGKLHDNIQILGRVIDGELSKISYTKSRENTPIYWTTLASASVAAFVNIILFILVHLNISHMNISRNWYIFVAFVIVFTFGSNYILGLLAEWIFYKRIARIPKIFSKFHEQSWEI